MNERAAPAQIPQRANWKRRITVSAKQEAAWVKKCA